MPVNQLHDSECGDPFTGCEAEQQAVPTPRTRSSRCAYLPRRWRRRSSITRLAIMVLASLPLIAFSSEGKFVCALVSSPTVFARQEKTKNLTMRAYVKTWNVKHRTKTRIQLSSVPREANSSRYKRPSENTSSSSSSSSTSSSRTNFKSLKRKHHHKDKLDMISGNPLKSLSYKALLKKPLSLIGDTNNIEQQPFATAGATNMILPPPPIRGTEPSSRAKKEMMSTIGLALSLGIIISLAMSSDPDQSSPQFAVLSDIVQTGEDLASANPNGLAVDGFELVEDGVEGFKAVTQNIISAAVPESATDVIAIALGEGIAGAIGALSTFAVGLLLKKQVGVNSRQKVAVPTTVLTTGKKDNGEIAVVDASTVLDTSGGAMMDGITEAVADGDYFLTRSAVLAFLQGIGVPSFGASLASVVLATVPYELVKIASRQRQELKKENLVLNALLRDELERDKKEREKTRGAFNWFDFRIDTKKPAENILTPWWTSSPAIQSTATPVFGVPGVAGSMPVSKSALEQIDFVEIFSDVTKWLEYDVLSNDFGGKIMWQGHLLPHGLESAAFGLLAGLSSQLYADTLYIYLDYGPEEKRNEVRTRTLDGWASVYTSKCVSTAALFGVYETVSSPVSKSILALLTGGVDSCVGSDDFDVCMKTYMSYNPPGASVDAQVRAFLTAVLSLLDRLQTELLGDMDFLEFGRGLIVQIYSQASHILPLNFQFDF